ncbi:MAG: exo-alpha-sialidase [Chloroflexota bacterium]|nr:exo-alpha-sialidase [Chloroflexota bacterium]
MSTGSIRSRALRLAAPLASGVIAIATALALAAPAFAAPTLLRISTDPYTNTTSQHQTEVEPDTLSAGSTIVSTFQVGRFFNGGASNIGFATSTDGGATFTHGFLPGTTVNATPAGTYARASDASVAYDARHGVWLISYLGIVSPSGPVDVVVSRSTDGGLTWGSPVVVNASGHFNDKNWTVCDNTSSSPFYGHCYTEYDDNTLGDLIQMSVSTNGGLTWSAGQATATNGHGIGGQPLVQPNGNVIVPIVGFAGNNFLMLAFTSNNGGDSWSKTHIIARIAFHRPNGGIRASIPLPSAELDNSGKAYVVWSDCHFEPTCAASDLVLSTSIDGQHWSTLTRIPVDARGSGVDHFIPGLAVDRSTSGSAAHLALAYYYYPNANCTSATCQLDIGSTTSTDSGASWSAPTKLAGPMSLSWLPSTTQGTMVGDYISTSFSGSAAFPAFAVANAPTGGVFDEATYTVSGGLSASASAIAATDTTSAASSSIPTAGSLTAQ